MFFRDKNGAASSDLLQVTMGQLYCGDTTPPLVSLISGLKVCHFLMSLHPRYGAKCTLSSLFDT